MLKVEHFCAFPKNVTHHLILRSLGGQWIEQSPYLALHDPYFDVLIFCRGCREWLPLKCSIYHGLPYHKMVAEILLLFPIPSRRGKNVISALQLLANDHFFKGKVDFFFYPIQSPVSSLRSGAGQMCPGRMMWNGWKSLHRGYFSPYTLPSLAWPPHAPRPIFTELLCWVFFAKVWG